jgi:hypothetical protein
MEAGRELDAEIAAKVMGWTRIGWDHQWNAVQSRPTGWPNALTGLRPGCDSDYWMEQDWTRVPHYSTDIAYTWEVVERIGIRWTIDCVPELKTFRARCEMTEKAYIADGNTAPLAICLAALEAVDI